MTYLQFLDILRAHAEPSFAMFQSKLIFTKYTILGVRTPIMRKIAKEYQEYFDEIVAFPNEYYEVVFIKLTLISALSYERFVRYLEECIALMDNWALCDCFKAKCIKRNREEFLPVLEQLFEKGGEYEQRYPLVVLLSEYVVPAYLPMIKRFIVEANTEFYYVHMAVAWLMAEILVKRYDCGVTLLNAKLVDVKTHNKAIQKAIESYRLTLEQKEFLRSLKIKTNL